MNKVQYNTKLYNGSMGFFSVIIVYFGSLVLWIYFGRMLNIPSIVGIPICLFIFVSPLIFRQRIKSLFTRKILLEMDKDSFSVLYLDSEGRNTKKQAVYSWDKIQSYNFYFGESTPSITALTIHLKKGLPKSFNFIDKQFNDKESFNKMLKGECLLTVFYNQVKLYNVDKAEEDQIQLLPGFFASKTGTIVIYSVTVLLVLAIVLHLIIDPKSSFATLLISIGLVTGFFVKRKGSLELYKKIKELGNASGVVIKN